MGDGVPAGDDGVTSGVRRDGGELGRLMLELSSARTPCDVARALHTDGLGWLGVGGLALYRVAIDRRGLALVRPPLGVRERLSPSPWVPYGSSAPVCHAAWSGSAVRTPGRVFLPLRGEAGVIGVLKLAIGDDDRGPHAIIVEPCQRALDRALQYEAEHDARTAAEACSARLAEEIAQRDRSLAMLVHDLRNPLSAIVMSARILAESPDLARGMARIGRSAERMQRMVDQLLDFAKLRHDEHVPIERRDADLFEIVADAVDETRLAFPHARLEVEHAAGGDGRGAWDPERIAEVVSNLTANAVEHGGDGVVRVRVRADAEAQRLTIEVSNEGPAIARELLAEIFEPFKHGTGPATRSHRRGLGLGLYITRALVEAHGGEIGVTSDERTTCFRVSLPRR